MNTLYKDFERRAIEAGVGTELAHKHRWMGPLREWVDDEEAMIARALAESAMIAEACKLLFYTDSLTYDEGQRNLGISDERRNELEQWIFDR